ncbi:MAG: hypothetical protein EOP04_33195 [Proteobacteria bacterium]|nr:MAG: hypothetical protein EOP04_33195 [Pseudomonadota bacterium]
MMTKKAYLHLKKKSPLMAVFPSIHAQCWPARGTLKFRIVSYENATDSAFEYFGDFQLEVQLSQKFPRLREMALSPFFEPKKLGFGSAAKALESYLKNGVNPEEEVVLVRVGKVTAPQIRKPVGTYSFYPGTQIYTYSQVSKLLAEKKLALVDLRKGAGKLPIAADAILMPRLNFNDTAVLAPTVAMTYPFEAPASARGKNLIIAGESAQDMAPFTALPLFKKVGFNNVFVLKNGYLGYRNAEKITPESVVGISRIAATAIFSNIKDYVILKHNTNLC